MNKKTRALSYEQYLKIIDTILTGFVCADEHKVKPNKRIAAILILEGNLGLRISDILSLSLSVYNKSGELIKRRKRKIKGHLLYPLKYILIFRVMHWRIILIQKRDCFHYPHVQYSIIFN